MKNALILFVGLLVALFLILSMLLFQVRYDEVAVRTTFGGTNDNSVINEAGLYFRLPPPIQQVHNFPKRVQLLEDETEEIQTRDGYSVILRTYLAWRIDQPLNFFIKLQNTENAQEQIRPLLRNLKTIIGEYDFAQLVNTDESKLKLHEIEERALNEIRTHLTSQNYGVAAEQFGIRRLMLPQEVTQKVFDRMRQARMTMAQRARSEGEEQSVAIRSKADATRQIILAFAENRAQAIRTLGDLEAAEYYKAFQADQDLAIFLRKIETLGKILPHNSTFVLDAAQLGIEDLLTGGQKIGSPK